MILAFFQWICSMRATKCGKRIHKWLLLLGIAAVVLSDNVPALALQSEEDRQGMSLSQDWQGLEAVHADDLRWKVDEQGDGLDALILMQLRKEGYDVTRIENELRSDSTGKGLRPSEAKRLRELKHWLRVRQVGYLGLLLDWSGNGSLDLSTQELTRLYQSASIGGHELGEACQHLEQEVWNQLSSELRSEQQRKLRAEFRGSEQWSQRLPLGPSRLRDQLRHSSNAKRLNAQAGVEADGENDRHLSGFGSQAGLALTPGQLILSENVQRGLELSAMQTKEIRSIQKTRNSKILELHTEMLQQRQSGGSILLLGLEELEVEAIARESAEQMMDEVLLPEQRVRLTQLSAWMRARNIGGLAMLTDGSLGERLGVTSLQRTRLFNTAKRLQGEVEEKHAEMIQTYQQRLLEALEEKTRVRISAALGDMPVPHLLPEPERIIAIVGKLTPRGPREDSYENSESRSK